MKNLNFRLSFLLFGAFLFAIVTSAQELNLPAKSPGASVSYTIGYTEVTINYSSPGVRGRDVFGGLLPYDEVWRAGANAATTIEFSTDVKVGKEGKELAAGKYALFVIPKENDDWVVIFNTDTEQSGTGNYSEDKDAARVEVKARRSRGERLKYDIEDQGIDRGYFTMKWADTRLVVFIRTDALQEMVDDVNQAVEAAETDEAKASILTGAADVLIDLDNQRDKTAMSLVERAMELGESPRLYWVKAKIHAVAKEKQMAMDAAKKAMELGEADPDDNWYQFYKGSIQKGMERYKNIK